MSKFEMLKKLEHLVAFQSLCLADGHWDEFDLTEREVKRLESEILQATEAR